MACFSSSFSFSSAAVFLRSCTKVAVVVAVFLFFFFWPMIIKPGSAVCLFSVLYITVLCWLVSIIACRLLRFFTHFIVCCRLAQLVLIYLFIQWKWKSGFECLAHCMHSITFLKYTTLILSRAKDAFLTNCDVMKEEIKMMSTEMAITDYKDFQIDAVF